MNPPGPYRAVPGILVLQQYTAAPTNKPVIYQVCGYIAIDETIAQRLTPDNCDTLGIPKVLAEALCRMPCGASYQTMISRTTTRFPPPQL